MTRRVVVVIVVLLLIAGLGAILDRNGAVVGRVAGDAMFEGYPTRSWARRLGLGPADKATALSALERGGPQAVPVLIEILTGSRGTEGADLRYSAVEVLGKLGADAVSAGPALLKAVEDDDPHVRAVAAAALPRVETPAELAVPALTKLLASNHSVVAARALSVYRAQAASALPELEALLRDRNRETEVRWNAARTIGKIGPAALGSVPALIEHFSDREASIREHVAEAIGDIGPSAAEVGVPPLIPLLQDENTRVRRDAARSLGQLGPGARAAVPALQKLLDDPEEMVREASQRSITLIEEGTGSLDRQPRSDEVAPVGESKQ